MRTRVMRTRIGWFVLALASWLAPGVAFAQNGAYESPPVVFTGPLSHPRYESGGFFIAFDAVVWHLDRKIADQVVARRGFLDVDGTATDLVGPVFVGSGAVALNTNQLADPGTWTPGFEFIVGWRFEGGVVVTANWVHLSDTRYSVSAGPLPRDFNVGALLENSFLFSPVTNFSPDFAGPRDLPRSSPPDPLNDPSDTALYGIWNGAENMQIEILQRFDMFSMTGRVPLWQSESCRAYGLIGPRIIVMWERFKWRTVDLSDLGIGTASNNADYFNVVSNRLYGVHIGCGQEWFLGSNPIGAFSCSLDVEGGVYGDWVKARAKYEREDGFTAASRARNFFRTAFSGEAKASLWWYPWEAIQVRIGYNFLGLFNTIASERPIDFDVGVINPGYDRVNRLLHGFDIGIGFVF